MKRVISVLAVLLMLSVIAAAHAEVPQISAELFSSAKQALVYLASGEYERLVTLLPFSDVSPSASEWQSFAEGNFTSLSADVQTEYAVAYWTGSMWKLAVPVSAPESESVEVLLLTSSDGMSFSGYRYSLWSEVAREYQVAPYVVWDSEYISSAPVIVIE